VILFANGDTGTERMYMLWFKSNLGTIWFFPLFYFIIMYYYHTPEQRRIPNGTKGTIKAQHTCT